MASTPIRRIGVIGLGNVGARTLDAFGPNARDGQHGLEVRGIHAPRVWRRDRDEFLAMLHNDPFDVVVLATPEHTQVELASAAIASGAHVVATSDSLESLSEFRTLAEDAEQHHLTIATGVAMSPGLTTVLALHAAELYEEVERVSVGLAGFGGRACRERRKLVRSDAVDVRAGEAVRYPKGSGREVQFFPDPIGGRECERDDVVDAVIIAEALGSPCDVSVRVATVAPSSTRRGRVRAQGPDIGGVRVEVAGRRNNTIESVVYGLIGDPGAVTAVLCRAACDRILLGQPGGVRGFHELGTPLELLTALVELGERPCVYEGLD